MASIQTKYFDYGQEELDYLISADETLGAAITRLGRLEREVTPDLFTALVYAIIGQLISAKAVNTIWDRLRNRIGEVTPRNLASHSADDIQSCGMSMKKAICINEIAQLIERGEFSLDGLQDLSDSEVIDKLTALRGIGRWTGEMLLIHAMERRDVVSWGDIAIRRGMMKLYGLPDLTKEQFEVYRNRYSPYGSVASIYLWEISMK
ncbi:DNA-3-methyladenine glycosylase family protein [Paenibacillus harenae]|uniref:DNA-3-methyladenine glycosylase family protein n=1 Tax=Paenibacillus harenae TaxID=306543 RepID=UPI0003FF758C|nr:DNA-3-methyladenine glycosylase [Paenibacillus harenae]